MPIHFDINRVMSRLRELRDILVSKTTELGVEVYRPARLVKSPPPSPRYTIPNIEIDYISPTGVMKPVAVVKLREFYNRNLIFGSAVLYNSNVEVPLPLTQHGLAVRTDLSTMPLEDYIYLLLMADTLGLDYDHIHNV